MNIKTLTASALLLIMSGTATAKVSEQNANKLGSELTAAVLFLPTQVD